MTGIIGKKIGMTSLFGTDGKAIACTVIEAGPCAVTQVKTVENDGYSAVQLGYGARKEKHTGKALAGHFKKAGVQPHKLLREFRDPNTPLTPGQTVDVNSFIEGDLVKVVGYSKGKGFQGVVKRYGFSGVGGQTHGQHNRQRHPGSIGACSFPSRVFKGTRMAGRTGNQRVTIANLAVLKVFPEKNLIVISGSVPGGKNSVLLIQK